MKINTTQINNVAVNFSPIEEKKVLNKKNTTFKYAIEESNNDDSGIASLNNFVTATKVANMHAVDEDSQKTDPANYLSIEEQRNIAEQILNHLEEIRLCMLDSKAMINPEVVDDLQSKIKKLTTSNLETTITNSQNIESTITQILTRAEVELAKLSMT